MRIKHLTVCGFGPYKAEQTVDFEGFRDDGLFLISGKTGAGKSSILDAICYALYGSIPRFETTQQKLRSDYCDVDDPTFVELEFAVNGTDYRVRRTPEYARPKARGDGTTLQKPTAELYRRVDGDWEGVAARPVDVGNELDQILGLSKDQFLQVILLAQNRFQEFLLARNDDRQAVLRSLFGTRRFEQMEEALIERRKSVEAELGFARQKLAQHAVHAASLLPGQEHEPEAPDLAWFTAALAGLRHELDAASESAGLADAAVTAAEIVHQSLADRRKLQQRRDGAAARLRELETEQPDVDADRVTLATALRAAAVWPHVLARQEAQADRDEAASVEVAAREAYRPFEPANVAAITGAALKSSIDRTTKTLGGLESVLADELQLPALAVEIRALQSSFDECDAAVTDAAERIQALPGRIEDVGVRLAHAQARAGGEADISDVVKRLTDARTAAKQAEALAPRHDAALRAETRASGDYAAAAARIHELMQRRLAGHAGELAAGLLEGEPCAVCGSPDHPAPARPSGNPVTGDDIERARVAADACKATMDSAHSEARTLGTQLAEARTLAGEKTFRQLDDELDAAKATLEDARAAGREVTTLADEQARLRGELSTAQTGLEKLRADRDAAAAEHAARQSARSAIEQRIANHLAGHDTVSDHVRHLLQHLDAANALADAITESRAQAKTLAAAVVGLAAQLREFDFDDEVAVRAARLEAGDVTALEARIRAHEQAVGTARFTLAEPELTGLPATPIDLAESQDALGDARDRRDQALAAQGSLAERHTQLTAVVRSARAQLTESAGLHEAYAHLRQLAGVVQGNEPNTKRMRLETYVLAAQLEEIVAAANTRLRMMTSGRYLLEHDDSVQYRNTRSGLGLSILDQHTGRARPTHSLSGGETFLASLALALGLAEVVTNQAGGITLDTLFIDEGFGSLDSDTLEIAMGTLDSLRAGGRTIGLISHVDAMKEQIPAKLRITVTDQGWSEIEPAYELA
ncbi:AAA family ATPase [Glaciibacter sp. 2TAF33]|uniref:AAA family ATPase n=1 Tax=Glaciibacter sp. 2TAF33 TaxID=3233015 RepID=UPI003F939FE1